MVKQKKQTIILIILLAIVIIVYLLLKYVISFDKKEEDKNIIWSLEKDTIEYLKYTGAEEEIELTKLNGKWVLSGYEEKNLDSDTISSCLGYFNELTFDENIGTMEDLSPYGLDEPSNVITIVSEGTTFTITVGNYNSNASGYYIQVNGQPDIYIWGVSKYLSVFDKTAEDFIVVEDVSGNEN